ncbi:MAG: hypothetical protein COB37_10790 [Kordiimonadales bacterium]|nr:MAG: hypothetical protein COB37_10790 [Kordiimonadales bacterium]
MSLKNLAIIASCITLSSSVFLSQPADGATFKVVEQSAVPQDIVVGKSYQLASAVLERDWQIQVALPAGYEAAEASGKTYPVLYVLDGEWQFSFVVSLAKRLANTGHLPGVIVVGIPREESDRGWFSARTPQSDQLLDFIDKEVFAFIDGTFRTRDNRTIIGWAYAGGMALHSLVTRPEMFDAYVVSSAYPSATAGFRNVTKTTVEALEEKITGLDSFKEFLYFGAATNEDMVTTGSDTLAATLKASAPRDMNWTYDVLPEEDHETTPFRIVPAALKSYFKDYQVLYYDTLADYKTHGGVATLEAYYEARADKYGTNPVVDIRALAGAIRLGMAADDVDSVNQLVAEIDYKTITPDHAFRIGRFANFYMRNQHWDRATAAYQGLITILPTSIPAHIRLARAYEEAGKKAEEIATYKKAVVLAETQKDRRLEALKEAVAELELANS